ncbi:MAG: hypothetical protein WC029_08510 [Sulfuricella sp.]|jgi:hypothetical protein
MLLLGLELETGGAFTAPPETNFITKIGLVLWDTEFVQPVDFLSPLFKPNRPAGIRTQCDVDCPRNCASCNLICLAGFHGMVNPFRRRSPFPG